MRLFATQNVLVFLFAQLLLSAPAASTPLKPEDVFYWVVVNDNRLFATDEPSKFDPSNPEQQTQYRFLKHLCTARYCSALYPEKVGIPKYCEGIKITCPSDRMKVDGEIRSWGMLPEELKTNWLEAEARYAPGYATSTKRQLRAWLRDPANRRCAWKLEPRDQDFVEGSCTDQRFDVEIDTDYVISVRITSTVPGRSIPEPVSRPARVEDVTILVFGDSYASGEGNPHWPASFASPAQSYGNRLDQWWDRRCHRSLLSYPSQAVAVAAVQSRLHTGKIKYSYTLLSYACSGAEIRKSVVVSTPPDRPYLSGGVLDPYEGREPRSHLEYLKREFGVALPALQSARAHENLPAQIEQAKEDLCIEKQNGVCTRNRQPTFIVLSVGGNDAGFGPVLAELIYKCKRITRLNGAEACARQLVTERIEKDFKPGLDALAEQLKPLMGENTVVLLTEYPDITSAKPDPVNKLKTRFCDDFNFERVLSPARLDSIGWRAPMYINRYLLRIFAVKAQEARWAYEKMLRPINDTLRKFARERYPTWQLLGGIEAMSKGRGWCSRPNWFVTFDESKSRQGALSERGRINEAFTTGIAHPNFFGHDFMAWRLRCHLASKDIIPRHLVFAEGHGACEPPVESVQHRDTALKPDKVVNGTRRGSATASSQ